MARRMQGDAHYRMLRLLEANPGMSQRELARALGISLGGAHYCLNALIERGMIKAENFRVSEHKLRYAYILTPKGLGAKARLTRAFLRRKMAEYEALRAEIESIEAELQPAAGATAARTVTEPVAARSRSE